MKIALFNGLCFHYEMFGYIINYCYTSGNELDIYTNHMNERTWFEFYKKHFHQYQFTINDYTLFENNIHNYDLIFLVTDDDMEFKDKRIEDNPNKIICIDHLHILRRTNIERFHIGTRLFFERLDTDTWALPCYPIIDVAEKIKLIDNNFIHVAIIGGYNYEFSFINRLCGDKPIILHIITHYPNDEINIRNNIKNDIKMILYPYLDTMQMMELLLKTQYIFTDNYTADHILGKSLSGSIPLAFSNLSRLILSKQNNLFYKFQSAIEFDITTNDNICLNSTMDNNIIELISAERTYLINMFHNHVNFISTYNSLNK